MARILWLLSVFVTFASLSSAAETHLPPYTQMEAVHLLDVMWESWKSLSPWDDGLSPNVDRSKVGALCDVPPEETLKVMYHRRFALTLERFHNHEYKEYNLSRHKALRMEFYEKKMGVPPLRDPAHFCQNPSAHPELPEPSDDSDFLWPPSPYHLVCDQSAGKCVECDSGVTQAELKEACKLIDPPEEVQDPPSEAQVYYEDLKERLRGYPRGDRDELEKREVRIEGAACSAPPNKSAAYILIKSHFEFDLTAEDTATYTKFVEDWEIINKMSKNLTYYKSIFNGFTYKDVEDFEYCRYYLFERDNSDYTEYSDVFHEGGLICGGATCKSCKEWPQEAEDEPQRWTFERDGPLYVGCAHATNLGVGPRAGANKKCPKIDRNPKYCGYGKRGYGDDGCDGEGTEAESMADFWRRAGATGVFKFRGSIVSTLCAVVIIQFL